MSRAKTMSLAEKSSSHVNFSCLICLFSAHNFVLHGAVSKLARRLAAPKEHIPSLKIKVTVSTYGI